VISPLLWLLLAALHLTAPPTQLKEWDGKAPVFVTAPSQPRSDRPMAISVGGLPGKASNVVVMVDGVRVRTVSDGNGLYRAVVASPDPGVISLAVRFSIGAKRYQSPGPGVLVAAHGG
jgi:hypothetical protein